MTQTFWLEPTDEAALGLRRYSHTGDGWTCETGYHQAIAWIGRTTIKLDGDGHEQQPDPVSSSDPRWATVCDGCGAPFAETDTHQTYTQRIWRRTDTGEQRAMRSGPPGAPVAEAGACWDAYWMPDYYRGPDGLSLVVRCPTGGAVGGDHDWMVDSRASNCTRPDDNVHQCWVRHGDPRECHVTVDKDGDTCSAGAGSILTPNWHGFLRDGQLVA